jgi:hypothetical protein
VADWIELACLLDEDGQYSGARFARARSEDEQLQAARDDDLGRDDDPASADARLDEAQAIWRLLRRRADDFGEGYPFDVDDDETSLQTRARTRMRQLYAFLLAAASFKRVRRTHPAAHGELRAHEPSRRRGVAAAGVANRCVRHRGSPRGPLQRGQHD